MRLANILFKEASLRFTAIIIIIIVVIIIIIIIIIVIVYSKGDMVCFNFRDRSIILQKEAHIQLMPVLWQGYNEKCCLKDIAPAPRFRQFNGNPLERAKKRKQKQTKKTETKPAWRCFSRGKVAIRGTGDSKKQKNQTSEAPQLFGAVNSSE